MKPINLKTIILPVLIALIIGFAPPQAPAADSKSGLFVNLTTDDTWAAAKAVMFAHQKALKNGFEPVAIWLNVRGIYLADKNRPSHKHGLMKKNMHEMLQAFIKDGGTVYACQACSKAAGLKHEDFISGVVMGNQDAVLGMLSNPNVKTLSW